MSSDFNFNIEREVEQLRIAIEFHEQQIGRLESRIRELKNELKSGGGELSLVTGEMGAGTTTSSISIAERDDNPIISNLESLEDAYHAESWAQVESILKEQSDQQFTIQIDEYTGIDDGHEFVQEMLKRGHHVILVASHQDDLHRWLRDLADTDHYISERGINGIFPPRRSFDTCEIPRFDFSKPPQAYPRAEFEDDQQIEAKYDEGDLVLTPEEYDKSDPQTYIRDGFKIVGWYESGDEIVYQLSYIPEDQNDGEVYESDIEVKGSIEVVEDGGYLHNYKNNREDDLTQVSGVDLAVEAQLRRAGFETIDDLRRATEHEIAIASESSIALAVRIKADVGELVVCADEDCKATSDQYEDLLRDDIEYCPYHQDEDDYEDDDYLENIFEPEDKYPPQFHFDNLNIQLDYDIEQADGFFDLEWEEQCDLVELAAEHDLSLDEVETILDLQSEGDASC